MSFLRPRFLLRSKLLIYFILISALPLLVINTMWFLSTRNQILSSASIEVENVGKRAVEQIDSYLSTKLISLIIHSQTDAIISQDIQKATAELQNFLFQDIDVQQVSLLDKNGKEIIKLTRNHAASKNELDNQSGSAAFKITTFVGGNKYISEMYLDSQNNPMLDIAIPVVLTQTTQNLQDITTSSIGRLRQPGEIHGVLIEKIRLSSLWSTINKLKIHANGYVYVVDDKGNILSHPNPAIAPIKTNFSTVPEVQHFISTLTNVDKTEVETAEQTINETGVASITKHEHSLITNWGAITEAPLSDSLVTIDRIALFAFVLFLLTLVIVGLLSLWVSGQIVQPIELLQQGSHAIGSGFLKYRINIRSGDEIEDLGNSFNAMADKLEHSFEDLQKQDIEVEQINRELETEKETISAEKNKFAVVLSGIRDAIIAVDLDRKIITFNSAAERLTGYTSDEVIGKPIGTIMKVYENAVELSPNEYSPIRTDGFEGIVYSNKNLKIETATRQITVNLLVGQIREGIHVNLGCILSLHDITAENQLEEMKLDFVSMAAHELRTPLTSIKGYLSVYMEENDKNFSDEQRMFMNRIHIATDQLAALVENLLSVTRIERGAFTVALAPVDWVPLARDTASILADRAREKHIDLIFQPPTQSIPPVMADKIRINEVISNLLANAINYTQPGGTIRVSIEQKDAEVITHVQDTGVGIPKEALPKLFTKFFRVSGKLTQGSKGTGLGLYISKAIVEMHNGRIWVTSEPGRGTMFSFSLPIASKT